MTLAPPAARSNREEEEQALQVLLASGLLDKAPNLRRFLEYVAEQYFAGNDSQVKEYSIAVQALHRPQQFDPQSDAIVRVTAHALREKLERYYAGEGADHPIQIRLPVGKYILHFERKEQVRQPNADSLPAPEALVSSVPRASRAATLILGVAAAVALVVLAFLGIYRLGHRPSGVTATSESPVSTAVALSGPGPAAPVAAAQDRATRIRFGATTHPYVDAAGQTWLRDTYCKGGTAFAHPGHEIQGTDDPVLFQEGREGKLQCIIPVPPGAYQLQLLFADTSGDKEGTRQVVLSINNAATAALDIVDEAGGNDIVVGKVYTGIHPMNDGAIHLDFLSEGSFVNAAELTPSGSDRGLPLRMVAGPAILRDNEGNAWLPERFFLGGRRTFHPDNLPRVANAQLFQWERYGHFRYLIPVVADKDYRVKLYFSEGWFGKSNGAPGGIGSRVFDVYCNGTSLLKNFDILRGHDDTPVVITTDHVKPTAHGMLELSFTPVKNYALIDAIEIEPEN
jgi:Malectin domain